MGRKTKADKSEELLLGFLSDLEEEVSDGQNVSGFEFTDEAAGSVVEREGS